VRKDSQTVKYEPRWESLDQRPVAQWWSDAKFGVYLHWTIAAVPSWGLHETFYWPALRESKEREGNGQKISMEEMMNNLYDNAYRGVWEFHVRNYGAEFEFPDFAPMFKAELFDPDRWAELMVRSGAKYVVLTTKHHDGFCLWPNEQANKSWARPWNAIDVGPHQDLVGKLTGAVRRTSLKMGVYYSFYEWFNPLWLSDRPRFVAEHMLPQLKDLITRYRPDLLWADGEWLEPDTVWRSQEFLAWLFNESPVPEIVINDRWGNNCRHKHGGYFTTEYTPGMKDVAHAWEENRPVTRPRMADKEGRPVGYSWVYNRELTLANYCSARELILMLVDIVSRGGNLLLNVSPTADGRIPVIQEERLQQIGDWLKVNGEAIYGTRPYRRNAQWSPGTMPEIQYNQEWRIPYDINRITSKPNPDHAVVECFFTTKGDALYVIAPWWPKKEFILRGIKATGNTSAAILGLKSKLEWKEAGENLIIHIPSLSVDDLPCNYAYVLKLIHTGISNREIQ
jgi:alpha-L-fucosidase